MSRGCDFTIHGGPMSREAWNNMLDEFYGGERDEAPSRAPVASTWNGKGIHLVWDVEAERRRVAAAIVDEILGPPSSLQQEMNPPEGHMGAYETALWKLELELGGAPLRYLEKVIDENPGEVRRVLHETFGPKEVANV